uniref:Uncharacterized protein n=1 Tax=Physcomitrium patens TaxID=3218 RepID=A0A2K1L7D6_PHYPA|nr:hypothetical protein PHYPA_000361 [Physcomitrium patens]
MNESNLKIIEAQLASLIAVLKIKVTFFKSEEESHHVKYVMIDTKSNEVLNK